MAEAKKGEGRGVKDCRIIKNKARAEANFRGNLVPWDDVVPFEATRTNCIYDVPRGTIRGLHGHQIVHELCIAMSGSMTVVVEDYTGQKEMHISSPEEAAYIAPDTWITLKDFAPGTVLIVLCSGEFDPAEVVRTREAFDKKMDIYKSGVTPPLYKRQRTEDAAPAK
eukprot:TRINITY_DN29352_c0_g2_i1.p1 TRINITY_DN29352_c0_g2~~TRINITY_DN29352_c0_g2_i1.p1  ORF type:complete len:167 (-),score=42.17 TRINITY_DN29352_c0_g2_i1:147-647(-)